MIKKYQPTHKSALLELIRLNTPTYFDITEEEGFDKYLESETEDYFIVEKDDKVLGCGGINYELDNNTAIISWDIIHPDFQGQGIGKELTEYRISHIKTTYPGVSLVIVRTSQLTNDFYAKFGFELTETKKDYWAKGIDLYQMELIIK